MATKGERPLVALPWMLDFMKARCQAALLRSLGAAGGYIGRFVPSALPSGVVGGGDVKVVCCLFLNTGSPRRWCCSGRALPPSATAQQLHRDGKTGTGEHTEFEDGGKF